MTTRYEVSVMDGKYVFGYQPGEELSCSRYGEPWIEEFTTGGNAIAALVSEYFELRRAVERALNKMGIEIDRGSMEPRYEYYEALKEIVGR